MQLKTMIKIGKVLGVSKASFNTVFRSARSERAVARYNRCRFGAVKFMPKNSDDLFILGSGPSINNLSASQIQEINCSDSWAFNHFYYSQIKPSLHILAGARNPNARIIAEQYAKKLHKGIIVGPFYARGAMVNSGRFEDTIIGKESFQKISGFIPELLVGVGQKKSPDEIIEGLALEGFFNHDASLVPKLRSTVTLLVSLGLILRYKRIILCGIDMDNNAHFFDESLGIETKGESALHPHAIGHESVVNYLRAMNQKVALKRRSEILIGFPHGQLKNHLSALWRY